MTSVLTVLLLMCVVLVCALGVFAHIFQDTMLQCVGLSCIAFAALVRGATIAHGAPVSPEELLLYFGLVVYGADTVRRFWRAWRTAGRAKHPFRRSSDFGHMTEPPAIAKEVRK